MNAIVIGLFTVAKECVPSETYEWKQAGNYPELTGSLDLSLCKVNKDGSEGSIAKL